MNELFPKVMKAYKVSEVIDLLEEMQKKTNIVWRPVGDRENNLATINLGSDPAAGLIERITNALDAVLERKWMELGQPTNIRTPRDAVEQWFGIKEGRMVNEPDVGIAKIRDLSNQVQVTLNDSENNNKPTVDVRDLGVGITSENFSKSILSLNASMKLKKFFLAGAFGQGGSTALAYSQYTIIASRAITEKNHVAVTIVRFDPGDVHTDKHGIYVYAVDHSTGNPFLFNIPEDEFPCGTLVRHVAMDLGKYKAAMTAPTNSLWHLAHHYLFDPVLPYKISEKRENGSKNQNRCVAGNYRLLTHAENTEYTRSAIQTFRQGSVKVTWWVLSADGENAQKRIEQYTLSSKPIIITYNGQKQGELPNTIIRNDLKLPYLEKYLIVHIDCDNLDNESRRQLFPTTRESIRDTSLLDDLKLLVKETLEADDELKRLDRERKQRFIQRESAQSVESIKRRLATRIQTFVSSSGGSGTSAPLPGGEHPTPKPKPPIPIQDPPTFLEITNPNPRNVYSGRRFVLNFKTDADPSYFINPDNFIAIINPAVFAQFTGTTSVRDGYGTAYFICNSENQTADTANITLEIRPRRASSISSTIELQVIDLPEVGGADSGNATSPNISLHWVTSTDNYWRECDWDENSVAKVDTTDESTEVFVSAENKNLTRILTRAQRSGTDYVEAIKDFYLEHVSFYALLQDINERKASSDENNNESDGSGETENIRQRELIRASETVCGVMEQMYGYIIQEAAASGE